MIDKRTGKRLQIETAVLLGLNAVLMAVSLLWIFA